MINTNYINPYANSQFYPYVRMRPTPFPDFKLSAPSPFSTVAPFYPPQQISSEVKTELPKQPTLWERIKKALGFSQIPKTESEKRRDDDLLYLTTTNI